MFDPSSSGATHAQGHPPLSDTDRQTETKSLSIKAVVTRMNGKIDSTARDSDSAGFCDRFRGT